MKKFFKISLILLLIICCVIPCFIGNNYSSMLSAKAENSSISVDFFGEDRLTNIYSVDNVSYGSSIKDLSSFNLLLNIMPTESFKLNTANDYKYFKGVAPGNGSSLYFRGISEATFIDNANFYWKSQSGLMFYRIYDENSNIVDLSNKTVIYSVYIDDYLNIFKINLGSYSSTGNVWTSQVSTSSGVIQNSRARIYYNASSRVWEFGLDLWDNIQHKISFLNLNYDEYHTWFSLDYLKYLYFNNQTQYKNIYDFNLVFTDDYYSYNNYFNENYIILYDKNLYCVSIPNNYDVVDSSQYSSFYDYSMGDNLLNQINIDSIKFYVTEFYPLDDTPLYTLKFRQQNPNIILNTNIYSTFIDYYNNTYYYKIYGYIEDNLYLYDIYLYRVNMTDFEHFCFYPCPPDLFIIDNYYMNNFFSYVFYDTQYYFKYDIDFNMNYYYADYFALLFHITDGSNINNFSYYDTSNRLYNMGSWSVTRPIKGINSSLMLNSYVNSFSINIESRTQFVGLPVTDDFYYQLFEEIGGLEFFEPKVYYYQSNNQSNGNNIIPTDTSGLYKQKQNWWDFGTDIYNMFIYIIFEAPIISNITELVYLIIALIINTILTIVGLFSSVNNTIFIAMILGFLLFKFITKKFLGGSS